MGKIVALIGDFVKNQKCFIDKLFDVLVSCYDVFWYEYVVLKKYNTTEYWFDLDHEMHFSTI